MRLLGRALLQCAPDLIDAVAARAAARRRRAERGQAHPVIADEAIEGRFVRLGTIATIAVGRWLCGESVDSASAAGDEFSRVAAQLIAASDVPLGEVVRRWRYWRDACDLTLRECAEVEGVCPQALAAARESIGRAADRALGQMSELFDRERARITAELAAWQRRLAHLATHDALTSLANRALLGETLERMLQSTATTQRPVAVLFIDLDNFKCVNDSYGHDVGDQLLVAIARRLEGAVQGEGTLGRLGGDEFVVLTNCATPRLIASRIITALQEPFELSDGAAPLRIGASVGIASSTPGATAQDLLKDADVAMYSAKQQGALELLAPPPPSPASSPLPPSPASSPPPPSPGWCGPRVGSPPPQASPAVV